eukprot:COSAG01_NODE_399_length_17543_cov_15.077792_10_plen_146_part_00
MDRFHDGNGRLTGDQQPVLHAPVLLAAPSLSKPVGGGGGGGVCFLVGGGGGGGFVVGGGGRFVCQLGGGAVCLSVGRGAVRLSAGRGERLAHLTARLDGADRGPQHPRVQVARERGRDAEQPRALAFKTASDRVAVGGNTAGMRC